MDRLLTQIARVDSISDRSEMVRTLTELIDRCLRQEAGRELSVANKIEVALEYMRAHYNEDIVINDLAARLDMSPGYFSSMFKKEARQSAMQYLTSLRKMCIRDRGDCTDARALEAQQWPDFYKGRGDHPLHTMGLPKFSASTMEVR